MIALIKKLPFLYSLLLMIYTMATNFLAYIYLYYYRKKYKSLSSFTIRNSTTDIRVFYYLFVRNELSLENNTAPSLIIDCGAYTGLSSLYYHLKYPKAKIIAIEPEDSNYKTLVFNTKKINQIIPIKGAVWDKKCRLYVSESPSKWGFTVSSGTINKKYVSSYTIGEILKSYGRHAESVLLKLDIEGSEKRLFSSSNINWISKISIIQIELHDRIISGCSQSFFNVCSKDHWSIKKMGEKYVAERKI